MNGLHDGGAVTLKRGRIVEPVNRRAPDCSRRRFVGTLGMTSLAAVTAGAAPASAALLSSRSASQSGSGHDFLFEPGLVYLDTAALGPCPRRVIDATVEAWHALEANPKARGYADGAVLAAAERTRQQAAQLLGCAVDEIVISRSTTDGMNAIAAGMRLSPGDRVLTSDQEHEGGSMCWRHLSRRSGLAIDVVPIPTAENDPGAVVSRLSSAITTRTRVISITHVLGSTGLRMPVQEISALARSRGLLCVVDGAQAVGGIDVNVKALGCHAYATSGHKWLMGPKGTGLLYIAREASDAIQPMQLEDASTYYSESSGVGNIPGAVGLGVAIQALTERGISTVERHNLELRTRIHDGLRQLGVGRVVSPPTGPLATSIITFELPPRFASDAVMRTLRDKHRVEVKPVPRRWLNGLRFSPHIFNADDDVRKLLTALRTELV